MNAAIFARRILYNSSDSEISFIKWLSVMEPVEIPQKNLMFHPFTNMLANIHFLKDPIYWVLGISHQEV